MTIMFFIKYIGTSSPKKLRWVIYYTVYRMGPQQKHIKTNMIAHQSQKSESFTAGFPLGAP